MLLLGPFRLTVQIKAFHVVWLVESIYIEWPDRKRFDDRGCEKRKTISINGGIPENVRIRHVTGRAHANIN